MTRDDLNAIWLHARSRHPVDDSWLVLADALEEYGERRLGRRISRFVRRYRRYRRAVDTKAVAANFPAERRRSTEIILLTNEKDRIVDAVYDVLFR